MRVKYLLLISSILLSFKLYSQSLSFTIDIGQSFLNGLQQNNELELQPKLYYGFGVAFIKLKEESKWGYQISGSFNKRGYEMDFSSTYSTTSQFSGVTTHRYTESNSKVNQISITLAFMPSYKISEKLQLSVGPHYTYAISAKNKVLSKNYQSFDQDPNRELLNTSEIIIDSTDDPSSYGVKSNLIFNISSKIDIGLDYQYARLLSYKTSTKPVYNIYSLTAKFNLK